MITDQLAAAGLLIVSAIVGLIPEWTPDLPDFAGMGAAVGGSVGMLNGYFPVLQLGAMVVVFLSVRLFFMLWHALVLAYSLIPFKMT